MTGVHFVEFLLTHHLLFVKVSATLQRCFREGQIGIRCDELLPGSKLGCGGPVYRGSRLGVVDDSEHLTPIDPISFMNPDFDDVPHDLTREIAGLRSAHRAYRLQHIRNVCLFHPEHSSIALGFFGWHFRLLLI